MRAGFRARVLSAAVLSSALFVPLSFVLALRLLIVRVTTARVASPALVTAADLAECRRDPTRWGGNIDGILRVQPFDTADVLAQRVAAPLPTKLMQSLSEGVPVELVMPFGPESGVAYRRVGAQGPCSLLVFRWKPPRVSSADGAALGAVDVGGSRRARGGSHRPGRNSPTRTPPESSSVRSRNRG